MSKERMQYFSVGLRKAQIQKLNELVRIRANSKANLHRADLIREAIDFYLMHQPDSAGSRKAIAKNLEGKVDTLDAKVDTLTTLLQGFIDRVMKRREG